jgi:hypothetical protein
MGLALPRGNRTHASVGKRKGAQGGGKGDVGGTRGRAVNGGIMLA